MGALVALTAYCGYGHTAFYSTDLCRHCVKVFTRKCALHSPLLQCARLCTGMLSGEALRDAMRAGMALAAADATTEGIAHHVLAE